MSTCHMVCDACGHLDTGSDSGTYECEVCGSGSGWGYDNKDAAERMSRQILDRQTQKGKP